jgi:hypothetical protein
MGRFPLLLILVLVSHSSSYRSFWDEPSQLDSSELNQDGYLYSDELDRILGRSDTSSVVVSAETLNSIEDGSTSAEVRSSTSGRRPVTPIRRRVNYRTPTKRTPIRKTPVRVNSAVGSTFSNAPNKVRTRKPSQPMSGRIPSNGRIPPGGKRNPFLWGNRKNFGGRHADSSRMTDDSSVINHYHIHNTGPKPMSLADVGE